jgi:hypothetical protein
MNTDPGEAALPLEAPDLWHLPEVLDVRVRRRRFDPPRRVTTEGVDREVGEAVEVEIRVSEPFGIRALGPVLWVGEVPLTIGERSNDDLYGFFSFEPEALQADAPISLGWNSPGAPRRETHFRYHAPSE